MSISNFKAGKFYFDKMFVDNWTLTPVHYAGEEFDGTGKDRWVNPSYKPTSRGSASLSKDVKRVEANLFVPCWGETDVEVMELLDEVIDFVEAHTKSPYTILNTSVIDHGWHDTNKVFGILMFSIEGIIGDCQNVSVLTPVVNANNNVVNNTIPIVN